MKKGVVLSRKTLMLYRGKNVFINGESFGVGKADKAALEPWPTNARSTALPWPSLRRRAGSAIYLVSGRLDRTGLNVRGIADGIPTTQDKQLLRQRNKT
jgi:hypothetical protein